MPRQVSRDGAAILPFPAHRWTSKRLTARDRADALEWVGSAPRRGHARISFHKGPGGASEDMLLASCRGETWTVRGLVSGERRFGLWHGGSARAFGVFPSVRDALEAIPHCMSLPTVDLLDAGWDRELFRN
ncbi:MAG TPA: hypothetical protein VLJ20_06510 [Acetobacteraceae bacterium]|nr:hypothetical protein [Acetobacteraceae bacterium]